MPQDHSAQEHTTRRNRRWVPRWSSFLTGVCIGLLIVTPVLASGNDEPLMLDWLRDGAGFLFASGAMAAQIFFASYARWRWISRFHGQR